MNIKKFINQTIAECLNENTPKTNKVFFHGTSRPLNQNDLSSSVMYFTDNYNEAIGYSKFRHIENTSNIVVANLEMKKTLSDYGVLFSIASLLKYEPNNYSEAELVGLDGVVDKLKGLGYDSAIMNDFGFMDDFNEFDAYIVFDAKKQVKILKNIKVAKENKNEQSEKPSDNITPNLNSIAKKVIGFLKKENIVSDIFGIGSYFFPKNNKKPNDVDFLIKLNIPFENHDVYRFSDKLEEIKDNFVYEGESLVNVFVVDSKNRKLNSVDLWFIKHKGESLNDNIKERENQIYWTKKTKL